MEKEKSHFNAKAQYEAKIRHFTELFKKQSQSAHLISNIRLIVSLGTIAAAVLLYLEDLQYLSFAVLAVGFVIFIALVTQHRRLKAKLSYTSIFLKINEDSLHRINGDWAVFSDTGEEFIDPDHVYSFDLDIFGKYSLFQMINTTRTFLGRNFLKNTLTNPLINADEIYARQKCVQELSEKMEWRQMFQAEGIATISGLNDPDELFRWAAEKKEFYRRPTVVIISRLLPVLTILSIVSSLFFRQVPASLPVLLAGIQTCLLFWRRKDMTLAFGIAHKYKENIKTYTRMVRLFELENFTSPYLLQLKDRLRNKNQTAAYAQIKNLEKAVDMTYMRYNQLYFLFNILTLWDFHCQIALERWKTVSGTNLKKWLSAVGEVEMLSSLALISYDHHDWAFPEISETSTGFSAKNLGHPLLPESRISNNLKLSSPGEIFLITGSNMSGKSTLLRTAGINLVLAYSGAPVCADKFRSGLMKIFTSMRINDDLASSTSSFYAELLRIKTILDAAKKKDKPVFFLLDEIFKGTNSLDRHTGARYLIKMLSKSESMGLVSTHDLELGKLSVEKDSKIKNYHFEEYYQNGRLYFDYKLKPGVSTTRNAIYLMKMAGIEIEESPPFGLKF